MKKTSSWLWGGVLVALGVILAVDALNIVKINIFFPGWWTLFIIVPCAIGLFTEKQKSGDIAGLIIGIALLMACLGVVSFGMLWKLILPFILVVIGLSVIARATTNGKVYDKINHARREQKSHHHNTNTDKIAEAEVVEDGAKSGEKKKSENAQKKIEDDIDDEDYKNEEYWSTFSDQNINYSGKAFGGCRVDAVFGGADLDLREAKIKNEAIVRASSIFGSIIIYLPDDVNVEVASSAIFGGVDDKRAKSGKKNVESDKRKTLFIDATCVFGGVEIR